jgi:hypothetical protein
LTNKKNYLINILVSIKVQIIKYQFFISELERYLRNFICSGDLESRKLVTVAFAWHNICQSFDE